VRTTQCIAAGACYEAVSPPCEPNPALPIFRPALCRFHARDMYTATVSNLSITRARRAISKCTRSTSNESFVCLPNVRQFNLIVSVSAGKSLTFRSASLFASHPLLPLSPVNFSPIGLGCYHILITVLAKALISRGPPKRRPPIVDW
jgi:hypothetical protein